MEQIPAHDPVWNRKLISMLWWILLTYEVASLLSLLVEIVQGENWRQTLLPFHVIPTFFQLGIMGVGYLAIHRLKSYSDFIMIIWTMTMACVFILSIPELSNNYAVLCIPILLSSIYFQKKYIVFASSLGIACFLTLTLVQTFSGIQVTAFDVIVGLTVLLATTLLCFAIMERGLMLMQKLKESVVREQDLLIRNVMIDRLSKVDALTELFNHRSFQEHADHLISHIPHDTPLELALMDIDNFKLINDTYGHWVGDVVLKTVGSLIQEVLGPDDMSFRYGGEEFAVLFVGKSAQEVLGICEKMMALIRSTVIPEMPGHKLTMSIGVATYNRNTMKKAWFQLVDECLYKAKRNGKDCIYRHQAEPHVS
ncbi:GGDEF domain-containing protein [Paenibacillus ferrarius]|uniref:GGDEF domain-containing protein n=1 Tax=Paenibacillus ferrarius TaxID=1469647 RepID=UPI003D2BC16E